MIDHQEDGALYTTVTSHERRCSISPAQPEHPWNWIDDLWTARRPLGVEQGGYGAGPTCDGRHPACRAGRDRGMRAE